jgi:hypothetical protein
MNAITMADVTAPKSDQWNADDFIAGPITFTIREVQLRGGQEQPVNILLEGTDKAYRPCKGMARVMMQAWGPDAKAYAGKSLTLFRDPTVKWGGLEVGGIRISHMSHLDGKMMAAVKVSRGQVKPATILPLVMDKPTNGDRAKAEKWLAEYQASPTTGPATDRALAKLKAAHPDLYALAQATSDDPFSGPADEQIGETHNDVDPFRDAADRLIAKAKAGEAFSDKDAADMDALPEALREEVDAACVTA